ncbi:MAG: SDR family oxidoreductase, partial [candidate division NC10 bacterium]|nr:SDR family oxidoreductase [candidate division NC10 bacterium]
KDFHNEYERSKHQAEGEISSLCREAGLPLSIYRPSIVYGDSRTGHSLSFNALYYPVRILLLVKDMLERDIRERSGQQAQEMGVSLLPDGRMRMPIRVGINGGGSIDLIPIDHLVQSVLALMEAEDSTGVFHIVNPQRLTVKDLIQMIQETYPMTGIETVPEEKIQDAWRSPLETLIDYYMEVYKPYLNDLRAFDDARARPILKSAGLACPPLTLERFHRCMAYARTVDWGNGLRL